MRLSKHIKPVSFLRENASRLVDMLDESDDPLILTQDGEAKAVLMSIREYERAQDALALLSIVASAEKDIKAGVTIPAEEALGAVCI